jgi:division/cell wall cluster transcriptional repressor MraZ
VFRGRYEHAVDEKGRTSVPARFREVMSAHGDVHVVLTSGLDPCLVAYPMREWLAFEDRLAKLPQFDPSVAMLRRIYVSGAVECEIDKTRAHPRARIAAKARRARARDALGGHGSLRRGLGARSLRCDA